MITSKIISLVIVIVLGLFFLFIGLNYILMWLLKLIIQQSLIVGSPVYEQTCNDERFTKVLNKNKYYKPHQNVELFVLDGLIIMSEIDFKRRVLQGKPPITRMDWIKFILEWQGNISSSNLTAQQTVKRLSDFYSKFY